MGRNDLAERVLRGERTAISRAITMLEDDLEGSNETYRRLYRRAGKAFVVGVAGPPGAGKSTLINCLVKEFRSRNSKVGVVAVDPSSIISGGALMGDRVRMMEHSLDGGVFIRSLASRGSLGGVSRATRKTILVLDAAGFDTILVETVGVGQTELDIAKLADMTIVVLMPEMGDEVQAMKAGLLEIGDLFVMNKSDLDGADRAVLQLIIAIRERDGWKPPILRTSAQRCEGVKEVCDAINTYRQRIPAAKRASMKRSRAKDELMEEVRRRLDDMLIQQFGSNKELEKLSRQVAAGTLDPEQAASLALSRILSAKGSQRF